MVLSAVALSPFAAHGQNSTWQLAPPGNNFNDGANWTAGVPTDTATFGITSIANIDIAGGSATINTFQFNAGAPAYSFTASSTLEFQGIRDAEGNAVVPTQQLLKHPDHHERFQSCTVLEQFVSR